MGKSVSLRDNLNNILELNCDTVFNGSEGDMMHPFRDCFIVPFCDCVSLLCSKNHLIN